MRNEPLDHVLLHGPRVWARPPCPASSPTRWESTCALPPAPPLRRRGIWRLCSPISTRTTSCLWTRSTALNRSVEEVLYPAMEDYAIDIIIGKGPSANSIRLICPNHVDRGHHPGGPAVRPAGPVRRYTRLELYTPEELALIVTRSAGILEVPIEADGAMEIARRSRVRPASPTGCSGGCGTSPRCGPGRDHQKWRMRPSPPWRSIPGGWTPSTTGCPEHHGKLPGRPSGGWETLAATINEESVTLEDVYEPYLMQLGFLTRTPWGRCVTPKAYQHLACPSPEGSAERPGPADAVRGEPVILKMDLFRSGPAAC